MECLTAIGNGVVGKITEYTVEPVGRQVGYIIYYNRNLKNLQSQVSDLDAARETVEHKIVEEEKKGRKVETLVTNWLKAVNKITREAKDFLKDENQVKIKCLYGFCPNLMSRHQLSRKSTKLVEAVAELYGKKDFSSFAFDVFPEEDVWVFSTKDYEACDSRTVVVNNIMDELRNSNTDMIGLYGIGGVGKTTLVKEVYRQAKGDKKLFEEVVMVLDLKQNPSIERIQKEIAEKLGLKLHEIETPAGRALHICSRIKEKKTLVILDDIWENIDLEALGLPRLPTLKILLTSRIKSVLSSDMGTEKEFHLDVLDKKEGWRLFQKMAGDIVKKPDIQTVAIQVAEKCGGLPLLTVTFARTLRNSPLHAWKDALRRLKRLDGQGLTDKAYSAIEWSYSKLDNEELKSLFLLCASVLSFDLHYLLNCSMGLGLLKNVDTIGEAWDALNSLLEQLKDYCLLLDGDDNTCVRMHDLVEDVAKGIASRDQHVLSLTQGTEFQQWPDKEFWGKCTMINLDRCNILNLPDVLQCQELTFFCLSSSNADSSREIPCNFFKETKKLRVLDLTNLSMPLLPSSLQFLKNLRTLCLDQCTLGDIALVGQLQNLDILSFVYSEFKELPKEIGQLIRLRLLDLTGCSKLEVISPNVLSSLKRLEHLRMGNSFNRWEVGQVTSAEKSNAKLEELKNLHQLTALQIHIPDDNMLPADLFTTKLERFQICIGSAWEWGDVDEALNTLKLTLTTSNELDQGLKMLLKRTQDLYIEGTEGVNNSIAYQLGTDGFQQLKHLHVQNNAEFANVINGKVGFPNLTLLAVSELNGLRFLLSSSTARSLAHLKRLQISGCQIMEEIVYIEESDEEIAGDMFCQLQDLELKDLPNLTKFCSSRSYTKMTNTSSERLQLQNSSKPDKFTFDPVNKTSKNCEIEGSDSKENLQTLVPHVLFDKKVGFRSLKNLSIKGLSKLTSIWHNQLAPDSFCKLTEVEVHGCGSLLNIFVPSVGGRLNSLHTLSVKECEFVQVVFELGEIDVTELQDTPATHLTPFDCQNLESIEIDSCESLKHIFPASTAKGLQQLRTLIVKKCGVEEIIANEEGQQTTPKFVFSKVTEAAFDGLPKLRSFYPGMHASSWPSLNYMGVFGCDKVQIFASSFQEQREANNICNPIKPSLFLIEKDSFPNLERLVLNGLEIWNGPLPVQFFSKLKLLDVCSPMSKSVVFLDRLLPDLEGNNQTSTSSAVGMGAQLPHLRKLRLVRMHKLMHLGEEEDNSQSARPNFPNLEMLYLNACHSLRNLRSSAIPFNNLTCLEVSFCKGLKYLITYSVAKSLIHLTKLEVEGCRRLVEIVGNNEDDDDSGNYEITFRRLKHLKLWILPRLRGFCSRGNCSVKFPSLETLSISNRLKLKIFQTIGDETLQTTNEEEDTDVDRWEAWTTAEDEKTGQAPI